MKKRMEKALVLKGAGPRVSRHRKKMKKRKSPKISKNRVGQPKKRQKSQYMMIQ
jgi:hypothetical protein